MGQLYDIFVGFRDQIYMYMMHGYLMLHFRRLVAADDATCLVVVEEEEEEALCTTKNRNLRK